MRLERLGAGASTCLGVMSCTGSCDLLELGILDVARSNGVGCSIFIGGIDGSIGFCGDVGLGMNDEDCWWLVA